MSTLHVAVSEMARLGKSDSNDSLFVLVGSRAHGAGTHDGVSGSRLSARARASDSAPGPRRKAGRSSWATPASLLETSAVPAGWPTPMPPHRLLVISGGQTGVDRAALDAALGLGLSIAGWCPRGRLAEDGPLPARYPLTETDSSGYVQRTGRNVRDACATLILCRGKLSRGTGRTALCARRIGRPLLVARLGEADRLEVVRWIRMTGAVRLNVAGPRESLQPGIYAQARAFLEEVFALLKG